MNLAEYEIRRQKDALRLQRVKLDFVKKNYPEVTGAFQKKMLDTYIEIICGGAPEPREIRDALGYMRRNCLKALFREYDPKESLWILLFMLFPETMKRRRSSRNTAVKAETDWQEYFS